jgi:hypothetical protein
MIGDRTLTDARLSPIRGVFMPRAFRIQPRDMLGAYGKIVFSKMANALQQRDDARERRK